MPSMPNIYGTNGNDLLENILDGRTSGFGIHAYDGNDTIIARADENVGQIHIWASSGNDQINMEFHYDGSKSYDKGHHVRGDHDGSSANGSDTFNFANIEDLPSGVTVVGRIEDFDASRDTIEFNGTAIDLNNLPSYAKIVEYNATHNDGSDPQQWLLIKNSNGGQIFYALEGARVDMNGNGGANGGNQEDHFVKEDDLPNTLWGLGAVSFVDQKNVVPTGYTAESGGVVINDYDDVGTDVVDIDPVTNENLATIYGSDFGDLIAAGLNDDTVEAGAGDDFVWGGSGRDTLNGRSGNDTIWGGTGADEIYGNQGDDVLNGERSNDKLYGGVGKDTVKGNLGNDELYGGNGADTLDGGKGNDILAGGMGKDKLTGGNGADIFYFESISESQTGSSNRDKITDFIAGTDMIALEGIDAKTATAGDQDFTFIGAASFNGIQGELRYNDSGPNTFVQGDVDGDGNADFSIMLVGSINLSASDFIL